MREEPLTVVAGNALLSNIIYNQEHFLSVFVQVLKVYNAAKAPLSYVARHLKLFERFLLAVN